MTRLAALAVAVLLVGSACGGAKLVHGGSGVVTPDGRIGPLQIDVSTRADVLAFAGRDGAALIVGKTQWPGVPEYHALGYGCPLETGPGFFATPKGCRTVYYINARTHRLAAFSTRSPEFHTTTGIQPGMEQHAADRREHQTPQGPWNAIYESGRDDFIIPASCDLRNPRCHAKVAFFMLESRKHPIGLTFT